VLESAFKAELNLSNAAAVSAVAIVKKHLREGDGVEPPSLSREVDSRAMADMIRRTIAIMKGN